MSAFFEVDVELTLPVDSVGAVLAALKKDSYELPEVETGGDVARLAAVLGNLFEYDELEYVEAGGLLEVDGIGSGSMPYGTLPDLGDALKPFAVGTIDFTADDANPTRWRFRGNGEWVVHSGEVVYPTDEQAVGCEYFLPEGGTCGAGSVVTLYRADEGALASVCEAHREELLSDPRFGWISLDALVVAR